jgi:hypothetical protein
MHIHHLNLSISLQVNAPTIILIRNVLTTLMINLTILVLTVVIPNLSLKTQAV